MLHKLVVQKERINQDKGNMTKMRLNKIQDQV